MNDKNHLYSKDDAQKDQKEISKRRTQQGFSRFSVAASNSITSVNNTSNNPAIQIETKPQIGDPINDTVGSIGGLGFEQTISFDVFGSNYSTFTIINNVKFLFDKLPQGRHIPFTIDFVVNTATPPAITWDTRLLNPPTLPSLTNGLKVVLYFVGVRDNTSTRFTYISGSVGSGGSGGANTALSNLTTPTSVNQNIIPQAGKLLGDASNLWSALFVNNVKFGDAGVVDPLLKMIYGTAGFLNINVPTAEVLQFKVNDVTKLSLSSSTMNLNSAMAIFNTTGITFASAGFDPVANGEFRLNVSDVKVFSGGAVRNLSDIVVGGGANTALSNLTNPTSINQSLIPQAGKLLGDSSNLWSSTWTNNLKFGTAGVISATDAMICADIGGITFNVLTGDNYDFQVNGVSKWTLDTTVFTGANIILSDTLTINDSVADPLSNGTFQRNGTDVKVFSGGAVRNLTDIGGGANTALSNLAATSINQNLIPQAGKLLGSAGNEWSSMFANNVKFGTAGVVDPLLKMIYGTVGFLNINIPTAEVLEFKVNDVTKMSISSSTVNLNSTMALFNATGITMSDAAFNPVANGEFRRNGVDVKVFSGGALRNLSDIAVAGGNTISQGDSSVTVVDTTTGVITLTVDATTIQTYSVGSTTLFKQLVMSGAGINMSSQNISNAHQIQFETSGIASSTTPQISASTTEMIFSLPTGYNFAYYSAGSKILTLEDDGTLQWNIAGKSHRIDVQATAMQILTEATTDLVEFWTGTSRSNATMAINDAGVDFLTTTSSTLAITFDLIQNNDIPALGRQISIFRGVAENSASVDTAYTTIEFGCESAAGSITSTTENGYMDFYLKSAGADQTVLYLGGSSSGRKIAFFGVTPVVQQTVPVGATLAQVVTALRNLGLGV